MKKNTVLYILALILCFAVGCGVTAVLRTIDAQEIKPLSGGQVWDLSTFGLRLRVPQDAVIADHSRENAEQGGNALYAGSSAGKDGTLYLFCYENEGGLTVKNLLKEMNKPDSIAIIVGAEGGFSPEEAEEAKARGCLSVSLGNRILRCETAPLFALTAISYEYEL